VFFLTGFSAKGNFEPPIDSQSYEQHYGRSYKYSYQHVVTEDVSNNHCGYEIRYTGCCPNQDSISLSQPTAPPSVFLGSSLFCSHFSFPNDSYGENYGHLNDKKDKPNEKITGPKGTSPEVQRKVDDAGQRKRICFKQIDQKRKTG